MGPDQEVRSAGLLALRLLVHEHGRTLASVGGVTFALLLVLIQIGFRDALLDSALQLLRSLDADVIVIHKEKEPFLARTMMPKERFYQALSVEGVADASPLWWGMLQWKNLEEGTMHPVRVIGFDPKKPTFLPDRINALAPRIETQGNALVDAKARSTFGPIGPRAQIARRELAVVGRIALGSDFEVDGNVLVSEQTYVELTHRGTQRVEAALLHLDPGADPDAVVEHLNAALPGDVRAFTKQDLIDRDLEYWQLRTPVSIILLVGVALGFAVGVVICYQILYTEVLDHLSEFATLKAIGYSDRYVQTVVVIQAWALSGLGFLPAALLGWLMLGTLALVSGLPAGLDGSSALHVLTLSVVMCTASAVLALRKVRVLDPAELF